ncbi:MAG TPA: hypothetical protein VGH98_18575 [Gemmatimonadaceae bacterium]
MHQELTSRVTAFDRPHHFRDSVVRGAFAPQILLARLHELKTLAESTAWVEFLPPAPNERRSSRVFG